MLSSRKNTVIFYDPLSIDKIRPFLESDAGKILDNIKEGDPVNKCVFNKIGHALHVFNPAFREVTFGDNVKVCSFNNQIRAIFEVFEIALFK